MILLFSILLGVVVVWRGILPLKIHKKWKIALSAFTFLVAFKFYILRIFGGAMFFSPDLPVPVLLAAAWLFAVLMFFWAWLLLYEFITFIVRILIRIRGKKTNLPAFFVNPAWRCVGLLPIVLIVSLGMYEGLKDPVISEYDIVINGLPAELDGIRIAHLTDIHADALTRREKILRIVNRTNTLKPDLIVITGDFVDGRASLRGDDLAVLANLNAPMGVYGVPGNHEYYSGYNEWMTFLRSNGVRMLENKHVMLGGGRIALGGVTDPAAHKKNCIKPDIEQAFAGSEDGSVKILLAHQPKLAETASKHGVALQLSGHTHGGMVWGMDMLVAAFNSGRVSGEYDVNGMKLFISNGTGIWSGFPIRLGRRAEIALLILRSGK